MREIRNLHKKPRVCTGRRERDARTERYSDGDRGDSSRRFLIYSGFVPERVISGHFVTHVTGRTQCGYHRAKALPLLLCSIRRPGDASLARNGAGGIRFSGVRAARAENDVQNYFRGNDPFPTDGPLFPSSFLMKIITACSLFAWAQGMGSNLSRATSSRERASKER